MVLDGVVRASSVNKNDYNNNGPKWGVVGRSLNWNKLFISGVEWNPWWQLRIKPAKVSGIIVGNRVDGNHGEMFNNIEVRSGMNSLPLGNEIVGSFDGPGVKGAHNHFITFKKVVKAGYITLRKRGFGILVINGIRIQGTIPRLIGS